MANPALWVGHYVCLACEAEWKEKARPTECPHCGGVHIKWANFQELFVNKGKSN